MPREQEDDCDTVMEANEWRKLMRSYRGTTETLYTPRATKEEITPRRCSVSSSTSFSSKIQTLLSTSANNYGVDITATPRSEADGECDGGDTSPLFRGGGESTPRSVSNTPRDMKLGTPSVSQQHVNQPQVQHNRTRLDSDQGGRVLASPPLSTTSPYTVGVAPYIRTPHSARSSHQHKDYTSPVALTGSPHCLPDETKSNVDKAVPLNTSEMSKEHLAQMIMHLQNQLANK